MEPALYEKIGRQEVIIESLRKQAAELSDLVNKFIIGAEKPERWEVVNGQVVRKAFVPTEPPKSAGKRKS